MAPAARDGLAWDESGLFCRPVWVRQPDMEAITRVCRKNLRMDISETCQVSFHAEGAFNKIYLVQTSKQQFIMRVSLPVCPRSKTRGEVTTMRFLRRETEIPIPEVIAFNDQADDDIGFEWILMERMPGVSAWKKWRTLTTFQKVALVQRIAEFQAQIFRHTFSGIGTLKTERDEDSKKELPGEMVSLVFFMGEHFDWDVFRGPFRSSHDWLHSYLQFAIKEQKISIEKAEDEDDEEDALFALELAERLMKLLPKIFPSLQSPTEASLIWHQDLSLNNILVNDKGEITGVIDWESVSTMPLWRSTRLPKFLEGAYREKEPNREDYGDASTEGSDAGKDDNPSELDDEGKTDLYWMHLLEYEKTGLRQVYNTSMRHLRPGWNAELEANALKEDFLGAVSRCEQAMHLNGVEQWLDAVERGEFPRLMDILAARLGR